MAWTAPITWTAGTILTAALLNQQVRDNQLEMMPAKATTTGRWIVSSGVNQLVERVPSSSTVATLQTTTSGTYTDLATVGPSVTVDTGNTAIVILSAIMSNTSAGGRAAMSYNPSAGDDQAAIAESVAANGGYRPSLLDVKQGLTPGSNVFTAKYRAAVAGTANFANRDLTVLPL